jgi:hypothetical protein
MNLACVAGGDAGKERRPVEHPEPIGSLVKEIDRVSYGKARVVAPAIDWTAVSRDKRMAIAFTNNVSEAVRLCARGQPAIAILGLSKGKLAKVLRRLGSNVVDKTAAH